MSALDDAAERRIREIAADVCHFRDRDGFDVAVKLGLERAWLEGAAAEREAAARVCEAEAQLWRKRRLNSSLDRACTECAAKIRARSGEHGERA